MDFFNSKGVVKYESNVYSYGNYHICIDGISTWCSSNITGLFRRANIVFFGGIFYARKWRCTNVDNCFLFADPSILDIIPICYSRSFVCHYREISFAHSLFCSEYNINRGKHALHSFVLCDWPKNMESNKKLISVAFISFQ